MASSYPGAVRTRVQIAALPFLSFLFSTGFMAKTERIRFDENLIDLILEGEKDTTWRLWKQKGKDVDVGQEVSLQDTGGNEFARAKILWVKDTTFARLTPEDRKGHESFDLEEQMFKTFETYYDRPVDGGTEVKVIKFELLE